MKFRPWEYQRNAIDFIINHDHCALFLEMGLGKTVTTLTAVARLMDWAEIRKVLVVAPKKVAESTWTAESAKWDHLKHLRVSRVMGTAKQREKALQAEADIYVIGRDSYVWLLAYYIGQRLPFDMLVIDELTSFKSPGSSRFKAMRISRPDFDRIIGLTGTPAPNGLKDLWGQIYIIDGGERLGKTQSKYFDKWFELYRRNNIVLRCEPRKGADKEIAERIKDICLSMKAADYIQLPDLIETDIRIELDNGIRVAYEDFERENVLGFIDENTGAQGNVIASSAAALMNKLQQFANGAVYDDNRTVHLVHDEKLEALTDMVEGIGENVLIFYQFKHDAERIKEKLKNKKIRQYENDKDLQEWNQGEIEVLLAHPQSCAYGLNMQLGGHCIVWFGCGFNLELYLQANARLHRQGQALPVRVFRLVSVGTVDEQILRALDSKIQTQEALMLNVKNLVTKYGKELH